MTRWETVLALHAAGFWMFRLQPNSKLPLPGISWPEDATNDLAALERWFKNSDLNVGISAGKFGPDGSQKLNIIDVDIKGNSDGFRTILELDLRGFEIPETRAHSTPTGGQHFFFRAARPIRQGRGTLGPGLDTRNHGGYVVGPPSTIDGKPYAIQSDVLILDTPEWLLTHYGADIIQSRSKNSVAWNGITSAFALERASDYLRNVAPLAVERSGGDDATFKVAIWLKDHDVGPDAALGLLIAHWNSRCSPPWSFEELSQKVGNAYKYGKLEPGIRAAEKDFSPIIDNETGEIIPDAKGAPWEALNDRFAVISIGGSVCIVEDVVSAKGKRGYNYMSQSDFKLLMASRTMEFSGKKYPIAEKWLSWSDRKGYKGVVFMPEQKAPFGWLNLWRGFAIGMPSTVSTPGAEQALAMWLEHGLNNICGGDAEHFRWVTAYLAHTIQKPWEKISTALVFRGAKGTGKNVFIETFGKLLGDHFRVTADDRELTGNFNSYMEQCLMFVSDEASWAGDKPGNAMLKNLITGAEHHIERKGKDKTSADNLTRVVILGNPAWCVPASMDERRYGVWDVKPTRRQDTEFFKALVDGMKNGGYELLFKYLKEFDLSGVDLNKAPVTEGLLNQKLASLDPVGDWWLNCLNEGRLWGSDWGSWPAFVETTELLRSLTGYYRTRHIRTRPPADRMLVQELKGYCAKIELERREGKLGYALPELDAARSAFSWHMNHEMGWL